MEFMFPYDFPAAEIAKRLADNDLAQVLFNAPPGDSSKESAGPPACPDGRKSFVTACGARWTMPPPSPARACT
ncbi:hypothetical protein ACFQU7_05980 [Pseudoroseomonas wenyumeiae]